MHKNYIFSRKPEKNSDYFISVKLLTEHNLEFLSLKGGCTGSSESTFVKMPHCWKSHATAQLIKLAKHKISAF